MLYSEFITKLRADVGDFPIRRYDTADGDAATSVFQLQSPKVLESSYTFKVGGVAKTEGSQYALDKNIGQVIWTNGNVPASGNDNVTFDYQSVNQLDSDWLEIINEQLNQLRKKFWKEVTDETTLTSVVDQNDYALSGIAADVVHLLDFEYRISSTSQWVPVRTITDVTFYRDLQKIHMKSPFRASGYALRVRLNRAYTLGTATTDTFELQTRYQTAFRKFCHAEYLSRMAIAMMKETSAVSREKAFETMTEMTKLARDKRAEGLELLKQVRPSKPAMSIPIAIRA